MCRNKGARCAPAFTRPFGRAILRALFPRGAVAQFGRAREWHSRGRRFDPGQLHQYRRRRLLEDLPYGRRAAARPDADSTAALVSELRSGSRRAIRFARPDSRNSVARRTDFPVPLRPCLRQRSRTRSPSESGLGRDREIIRRGSARGPVTLADFKSVGVAASCRDGWVRLPHASANKSPRVARTPEKSAGSFRKPQCA